MAYEFMSLAEVEALSEVPENATVIAEVDGSIKRIPGEGLGGSLGGSGNSLVIVESSFTDYYNPIVPNTGSSYTYTANMEFADALAAFRACELTNTVMYVCADTPSCFNCCVGDNGNIDDCLIIQAFTSNNVYTTVYWTADGISAENPIEPT